jgi:very-short-patch-repair endonuclease
MHPRAVNWNYDKNGNDYPWFVGPYSGLKRWFKCDVCKTDFESKVCDVSRGHFCRTCKNKTERMLHTFLQSVPFIETVCQEQKFDWCRSNLGNKLPFDEYIDDKVIVEGDGDQHFKQVSNWTPHIETQERDIYKMKRAFENGKSVIRIYQEDIYRDRNQWRDRLTDALKKVKSIDKPTYVFISTTKPIVCDTYAMYAKTCNEYLEEIENKQP